MPTLLEIGGEIQELQEMLEASGGDVTGREEEVDSWLSQVDTRRDQKLDNYCAFIGELEGRSAVRRQEADRLSHRARVDADKAKWLKRRLEHFFRLTGLRRLETPRYRISLARHGGKVPVVVDVPADTLPQAFQKVRIDVKPDLDKIRHHLETEGQLTGTDGTTIARLGERGESLRIL
ncbi:MAG: hypothetical protein ACI9BV_003904 [Rhodothermales bacterium]|jgi:hypothetical protein